MITVLFSRKSAGKSTLVAQLASKLVSKGESVAILDTDPQGTIANWGIYRKSQKNVPGITLIAARHGKRLQQMLKELSQTFDHIIIDLQGNDSKDHRDTLLLADKIIIPFKPTQPDLDNVPYIATLLEGLRKKRPEVELHLVINEAPVSNAKVSETDQARLYFEDYDLCPTKAVIHSRKAYRDSMATGLGACELKDKKAKAEIDGLWSEIYRKNTTKRGQRTAKRLPLSDKRKNA